MVHNIPAIADELKFILGPAVLHKATSELVCSSQSQSQFLLSFSFAK